MQSKMFPLSISCPKSYARVYIDRESIFPRGNHRTIVLRASQFDRLECPIESLMNIVTNDGTLRRLDPARLSFTVRVAEETKTWCTCVRRNFWAEGAHPPSSDKHLICVGVVTSVGRCLVNLATDPGVLANQRLVSIECMSTYGGYGCVGSMSWAYHLLLSPL